MLYDVLYVLNIINYYIIIIILFYIICIYYPCEGEGGVFI